MSWLAAAGAIAGGLIGSSSSKKAAKTQEKAAAAATAEEKRQFDITRADMAPWQGVGEEGLYTLAELLGLGTKSQLTGVGKPVMPNQDAFYKTVTDGYKQEQVTNGWNSAGVRRIPITRNVFDQAGYDQALGKYNSALTAWNNDQQTQAGQMKAGQTNGFGSLMKDFTLEDFQTDPGYEFRQQQGEQALMRQASAGGRRLAPNTVKELLRFNSDLASQEFGNAFNRDLTNKQRKFNFMGQISGVGQTAATQLGQFGAQTASNVGNNIMSAGNTTAAGTMGQANAWSNAIGQATNAFQQQMTLDKYLKGMEANV
jgi:hypothetical protein